MTLNGSSKQNVLHKCFGNIFFHISELYHKNLLPSLPSHKPPEMRRNKNIKVWQPKVVINKLNPIKVESMDIDTIEVKIEEAPPIIPKLEHVTPELVATTASSVITNHALKSATLKKVGKDSPRKFVLTKGESAVVLTNILTGLYVF